MIPAHVEAEKNIKIVTDGTVKYIKNPLLLNKSLERLKTVRGFSIFNQNRIFVLSEK